mgnify:CR=1 FL=1
MKRILFFMMLLLVGSEVAVNAGALIPIEKSPLLFPIVRKGM